MKNLGAIVWQFVSTQSTSTYMDVDAHLFRKLENFARFVFIPAVERVLMTPFTCSVALRAGNVAVWRVNVFVSD